MHSWCEIDLSGYLGAEDYQIDVHYNLETDYFVSDCGLGFESIAGFSRTSTIKMQRLACICALGTIRTRPTAALEVMLQLTPLALVVYKITIHIMRQITAKGRGKEISSQPQGFK